MKTFLKIVCLLLVMALCFLAGWRVMPRVWPDIKEHVVYPVFPELKPTPAPVVTPEPYLPESSAAMGDEIAVSDSLIYYFYKDYCPYCAALEPLTAGLPERITLPDGRVSAVKLVCVNKNDEAGAKIVTDYYSAYGVPEERQYVPAMIIGERYLMPGSEIIDQLLNALVSGEGLNTPVLGGGERQEA